VSNKTVSSIKVIGRKWTVPKARGVKTIRKIMPHSINLSHHETSIFMEKSNQVVYYDFLISLSKTQSPGVF